MFQGPNSFRTYWYQRCLSKLQFKHGLPTIICTNYTKFYEYLLSEKGPDFQRDCMFCDVSGQYLGPLTLAQNILTPLRIPPMLIFQQLTHDSIPREGAAEDEEGDEEDEETMFLGLTTTATIGPVQESE